MKTRHPIDRSNIGRRDFLKIGRDCGVVRHCRTGDRRTPRVRSMRFGHMLPPDTVYHKAILLFADEVKQEFRRQDEDRRLSGARSSAAFRKCFRN
jgi:hypothetical protein